MDRRSAHVDTYCRDNLPPSSQWPELIRTLPELHYPARLNCGAELLEGVVAEFGPDRTCLRTADEQWTYADLLARSNRLARLLVEDLGLQPGNRVLLRGFNNPWLVACWFAVVRAGGVVVTTMPLLRARELAAVIDASRPGLVLCDHRLLEEVLAVPGLAAPVLPTGGGGPDDLLARAAAKPTDFTPVDTAADDVVLLASTSGTTGPPKLTAHTHSDVLAIADTFSRHVLRPNADDIFAGSPPLGFTFALGGLVVFPFRAGASAVLLEDGRPPQLAAAVEQHRATVLFTAPPAYRALLKLGEQHDLTSLRRCVSAGEKLPAETWQAFHRATGLKIIDGIGSTEMLHIFISAADDEIRPGATGYPVPGFEARVIDHNGEPVPDGVVGRLAVRGPTGCRYLADDRQRSYVQDGWNVTGDAYLRDADGYFWYQARTDDMIITSGYNVAPLEVEHVLLTHPWVVEAAVIGEPDPERGTVVAAHVVLGEDAPAGEDVAEALRSFVKQQLAPYKCPRVIHQQASLPKTATGKLARFELRRLERPLEVENAG